MNIDMYVTDKIPEGELVTSAIEAGLDGVVAVSTSFSSTQRFEQEGRKREFLVMRAVLYEAKNGALLIYGLNNDELLKEKRSMQEMVSLLHQEYQDTAVAIPAQPLTSDVLTLTGIPALQTILYRANPDYSSKIQARVDFNVDLIQDVPLQRTSARLLTIGGSGADNYHDIGKAYTCFEPVNLIKSMQDLVQELRSGRYYACDDNSRIIVQHKIQILNNAIDGSSIDENLRKRADNVRIRLADRIKRNIRK